MPQQPKWTRVREFICVLITFPALLFSQQTSKTSGPCSPIAPNNTGIFMIQCRGISDKLGHQLIKILNRIEEKQLDPDAVIAKINELLSDTKNIKQGVAEIRRKMENEGLLIPSDEPVPVLDASVPKDALVVNFGSNFAFSKQSSFVVCNIAGEDILTVTRSAEGIALDARIYSADGRIVAAIEKNEFTINPNNYFKKKLPDKSSFIVYDQTGEEAINVHFSNRTYVIVTGKFYKPGYGMLTVTSSGIHTPEGIVIQGGYVGENVPAEFIFGSAHPFSPPTHN
jgi:hypothetical protein